MFTLESEWKACLPTRMIKKCESSTGTSAERKKERNIWHRNKSGKVRNKEMR
jgi:hypothetical protein